MQLCSNVASIEPLPTPDPSPPLRGGRGNPWHRRVRLPSARERSERWGAGVGADKETGGRVASDKTFRIAADRAARYHWLKRAADLRHEKTMQARPYRPQRDVR
jgi:hypothetical protein